MKKGIILLVAFAFCSFCVIKGDIPIEWTEKLDGDFSFAPKHTLQCEARCYEFAGVSEIEAKHISKDTIRCYTFADEATHSTLKFDIVGNTVYHPRIELNSIVSHNGNSNFTYACKGGFMKIDPAMLKKNILKAEFDFTFDNPKSSDATQYWKGRILTKIKK